MIADRIKQIEMPQYFYSVVDKNKDNIECIKLIIENDNLPVPIYNDNGETIGFLPCDLYDTPEEGVVIRDTLDTNYKNDINVGKLEQYCMTKNADGFNVGFDKDKCLEYIKNTFDLKKHYRLLKVEKSTDRKECIDEIFNTDLSYFKSLFTDDISNDLLRDIISYGYLTEIADHCGFDLLVKRGYIGKLIENGYENELIKNGFQSEINEYRDNTQISEDQEESNDIDFYI